MRQRKHSEAGHGVARALLLIVALAILPALTSLGAAFEYTVWEAAEAQTATSAPSLTSRTAAGVSRVITLIGDSGKSFLRTALNASEAGDVFTTRNAIRDLFRAVSDEAFADPEVRHFVDSTEAASFRSSNPQNRTLDEGYLGVVRRSLATDRSVRRRLAEVLETDEAKKLLDNIEPDNVDELEPKQRGMIRSFIDSRRAWVAYFLHDDTRAMMLNALDADARRFSDDLWDRLDTLPKEDRTVDVMTIGGGLASSEALATIAALSDSVEAIKGRPISRLAIEASDSASSANFRAGGRSFAYNMAIRFFRLFGPEGPGAYANLAPLTSPVNPADLTSLKYGPAAHYGEAAAVALRASDSDIMTGTRVIDVVEDTSTDAPGFWKITLERNGQTREMWSDVVLEGVGAGKPRLIGDPTTEAGKATRQLIRDEYAKLDFDNVNDVPLIITGRDDLTLSGIHPEWRDAHTVDVEEPGLRDLVVGFGDSGFTTLQDRFGLGFDKHARANASRGLINGVDYAVGNEGPKTSVEYVLGSLGEPGARIRYIDIVTPMIKGLDNYLKSRGETYLDVYTDAIRPFIERDNVNGLLNAKEQLADLAQRAIDEGFDLGPETIQLRATRVESLEADFLPSGRRVIRAKFTDGSEQVYRRVVLNTGYENPNKSWLKNEFPADALIDEAPPLTQIMDAIRADGSVASAADIGVADDIVARQIPNKPYYTIGFGTGDDVIPGSRRAGVQENGAAFFNWSPLIRDLVRGLVDRRVIRPGKRRPLRSTENQKFIVSSNGSSNGTFVNNAPVKQREILAMADNEELALRVALAKVLSDLELDPAFGNVVEAPVDATLRFTRQGDGIVWQTENLAVPAAFAEQLSANRELYAILDSRLGRGESTTARFTFRTGAEDELYDLPRRVREDSLRVSDDF